MRHSSKALAASNRTLFRFRGLAPDTVFHRLPELRGQEVHVAYRPKLTAWRGQLLSRSAKGDAVYAGSFLRKRQIFLEEQMIHTPRVLERIFIHEIFHFVWSRLGRNVRESYERMIDREFARRVQGELGWSAESMKQNLSEDDRLHRTRRWRDYLCESFCDTAGWYFGSAKRYSEMTLSRDYRAERRLWVRDNLLNKPLSI
jgi:hypothetical protein